MKLILTVVLALTTALTVSADDAIPGVQNSTSSSKSSKWYPRFFNVTSVSQKAMKEGGAQASAYSYLHLNRRLSWTKKIRIALPFYTNTSGYDDYGDYEGMHTEVADPFIGYVVSRPVLLPGSISTHSESRIYFPVSEFSRESKQIAAFRQDFILEKTIARKTVLWSWPKFRYFLQTNTAYQNEFTGRASNTCEWDAEADINLTYFINDTFDIGTGIQYEWDSYFESREEDLDGYIKETFSHEISLGINLVKDLRLMVNVGNEWQQRGRNGYQDSRNEVVDYTNDTNVQYALFMWAGFRDLF